MNFSVDNYKKSSATFFNLFIKLMSLLPVVSVCTYKACECYMGRKVFLNIRSIHKLNNILELVVGQVDEETRPQIDFNLCHEYSLGRVYKITPRQQE